MNIQTWKSLQLTRWCWTMLIMVICCTTLSQQQFQSLVVSSDPGYQFVPVNEAAQLLSKSSVESFRACLTACHNQILCRVFDYGVNQSNECRLFEGDTDTLGVLASSPSPSSCVGRLQITADLFTDYNRPCASSSGANRYLRCDNTSKYECIPHSYWNSSVSMCVPQIPTLGSPCTWGVNMCREDLNLTCLQFYKCGPLSYLSGYTILNDSTVISGTSSLAVGGFYNIAAHHINGTSALFMVDSYFHQVVRFYDRGSTIDNITIVAKNWSGGNSLDTASSMFLDTDNGNNLYVSDITRAYVVLFSQMQSISPVPQILIGVTGSPGTGPHQISTPGGVALDSQNRLYISETNMHRVTRWTSNATYGELIAGTGTAGSNASQLYWPCNIHIDKRNAWLYVVERGNHRVQRFDINGSLPTVGTTVAGGNGAGAGSNQLSQPVAFWMSPKSESLFIADKENHRIQKWSPGSTSGVTVAGSPIGIYGSDDVTLWHPEGVTVDVNETYMYVSDRYNHRVQRFKLL